MRKWCCVFIGQLSAMVYCDITAEINDNGLIDAVKKVFFPYCIQKPLLLLVCSIAPTKCSYFLHTKFNSGKIYNQRNTIMPVHPVHVSINPQRCPQGIPPTSTQTETPADKISVTQGQDRCDLMYILISSTQYLRSAWRGFY